DVADPAAFHPEAAGAAAQQQANAEAVEPAAQLGAVEPAQGDGGQLDLEAAAVAQEGIDEDLAGVAQAGAFGHLVEGAGEDQAPEAVDGARGLAVAAEPVEEGRVEVGG